MPTPEQFQHALNIELSKPHAMSAKDVWPLGGFFTDVIKTVIDSIGLGDLTRDEFLDLVSQAFDLFVASMGIPPMLVPIVKALVLGIAGRIYDKRNKPTPVPNPTV